MSADPPAGRARIGADLSGPSADRERRLRDLFPEAVSEGKVDLDRLRALLGESAAGAERYQFSWAGRADAIDVLRTPSRATLLPDPERSVDFDATKNAVIEGDNLEVLKLLGRGYAGRVKLIYIDPPYNTGNDFVYPDDFRDPLGVYLKMTGQADEAGKRLTSNPDTGGRYHSNWLSMMYPRLFLARQLLRDDGVIFVSIDDHEVHHLRMLMNEVFGEENFVAQITWQKVYGGGPKIKRVVVAHEYVICYARHLDQIPSITLPPDPNILRLYKFRDNKFNTRRPFYTQPLATNSMDTRANLRFPIIHSGEEIWPDKQWQWSRSRVEQAQLDDELVLNKKDDKWSVRYKQYLRDEEGTERGSKPFSVLVGPYTQEGTDEVAELFGDNKLFTFPKPCSLIKHLLRYSWQDTEALVLDFFAGSGTTAQAVLELNREDGGNRQFILVQLPEPTANKQFPTIADICMERVRRVITKLKAAAPNLLGGGGGRSSEPEDLGFKVFRLAESHLKPWGGADDRTPAGYHQALSLFAADPLVPGWTEAGLLWELALKEGYGVNSTLAPVGGVQHAWRVVDPDKQPAQSFVAVLAQTVPADVAARLSLSADDLLVVRDSALDDTLAANLALQCRLKTI